MDREQSGEELLRRVNDETVLRLTLEELIAFCSDVVQRGLTRGTRVKPVEKLLEEKQARKLPLWKWLTHRYLYFRIPLLFPDRFLTQTLRYVRWVVSPVPVALWAMLTFLGLWFLLQRPQAYIYTFPHFFHWWGALVYGLAVIVLKTAHEFSHAYVAKAFGNRVPRMGVAFIVMWPIPFCDVTDSWRMPSRRRRLLISLAGILAECAIAGPALFVWGVAPDGVLKSIGFVLSSVTLVSTLLVNLNPAMRFDGYYIFSDMAGIDNLQARAFAVTKYYIRTFLFGMDIPFPEPSLSSRRRALMVVYSIYAWVYRFFLYISIALLVYYAFTKAIGMVLFVVEIVFFIVAPVWREVRTVFANMRRIRHVLRPVICLVVLGVVVYWLAAPLPRTEHIPATFLPGKQQTVLAPKSGALRSYTLERGRRVCAGETIAVLENPHLEHKAKLLEMRLQRLIAEVEELEGSREDLGAISAKRKELREARARLAAIAEEQQQSRLTAAFDGLVVHADESVIDGGYLPERYPLGRIVELSTASIRAFLPEHLSGALREGAVVHFRCDASLHQCQGVVESISPTRVKVLGQPEMSSERGGPIGVQPSQNEKPRPVGSWYEVRIDVHGPCPDLRFHQLGKVEFQTPPRSLLLEALQYVRRVILRESNF
jgi:putative peptide zinc metalloprotease protein